jgi:DNA-binding response OmpR family regulator
MGQTLTVLLVEDEPMATMLYEQLLEGTEFQLAGAFTCNGDAVGWLSANRPDVAIVDFFLEDGPCEPVMQCLEELNIPYIIVTGSGEGASKRLPDWRHVNKPFRGRHLRNALRRVVAPSSDAAK